jgi:inorganic triphosphatase YgiF
MEIELKFAVVARDPKGLEQRLTGTPALVRRKPEHLQLRNVYYDTANQTLRCAKVALRIRQIGNRKNPQWVQTLKIGSAGDSALTRRGEWEADIPGNTLDMAMLQDTPWRDLDPDGALFASLQPQCVIAFDRTRWTVRQSDGCSAEVALDIGTVAAGNAVAPICELEIELLSGTPAYLFALATDIAQSVPLIPLHISKSEQAYQLLEARLGAPLGSHPPPLTPAMSLPDVARAVLGEAFLQFTANLNGIRMSDDAEVVHQARIGWRRFKSALQLFHKHPHWVPAPPLEALKPLLRALAQLRDLEVAAAQTLPMFANAYTAGVAQRKARWRAMESALLLATQAQRRSVCEALEVPAVGSVLVAVAQWLECQLPLGAPVPAGKGCPKVTDWIARRLKRLHVRLEEQPADSTDAAVQHRVRILSKRLRYGVEALRPLLPKRRARQWHRQAVGLQTTIGNRRDIVRAQEMVARLGVAPGLVEFLRGIVLGTHMHDQ